MRQTKYTCDCCGASELRSGFDNPPSGWSVGRVTLEGFSPSYRNTTAARELCFACQERVVVTIKEALLTREARDARDSHQSTQQEILANE